MNNTYAKEYKMANQTVLVTGGAGFIGSNFILYWMKNHPEDKIINLDALTYAGNTQNIASVADSPNYVFVEGNITNRDLVDRLMADCDVVVHFAAESHVDRSILNPDTFIQTNIIGTHVLLESALHNGVKHFHHISTDEVFGSLQLGSNEKFTTNSSYDPRSPYSASKAGSDHLVRAYGETFDLPFTMTNCSNNYGPYHFPEKLIPLAITNIIDQKQVPVYGDGLNVRDWLYVEDHCRAIESVLLHGESGNTYLIGGMEEDISNLDLIKLLLEIMGADESLITFVNDRPGHDRRYAVDWSITQQELGWEPSVTIEEGLHKTVNWYKTNESWWRAVKNGEYQKYYAQQYRQNGIENQIEK